MLRSQINYMNMQDAVLEHLDNNKTLWENKKPIAKKVIELRANNKKLHEANEEQKKKGTVGYTDQKNDALESVISRSFTLALNLADWAEETNNFVLLNDVNFSASAMEDGSENEIEKRCEMIAKHGKTHAAALIALGYDVLEADIDQLLLDIEEEQKLVAQRDVVQGVQVNNTASIPQLINQSRTILKGLDRQTSGSKIEDEAFNGTYKTLRHIGGWHKVKPKVEKPPVK